MIQDCKVCLVQHDEEIHAATKRVHAWLRAQVAVGLHEAPDDLLAGSERELEMPQLSAA